MGRHNRSLQLGLSTVELLVTLLVAGLFIAAGYSLYSFVLSDSGTARAEAKATTLANDYLERYRVSSNTCSPSNPLTNSPVTVAGLTNVTVTVVISCPDDPDGGGPGNPATSTTKVEVTVNYNNPPKTIQVSSYAGPEATNTQDYLVGSSFPNYNAPTTPTFYWTAVPGATKYDVRYKVDTGSWVTGASDITSTTYTYNGPEVFRNQTVYIQVFAETATESLTPSKIVGATVPAWIDCQLQNGWYDYGSGFTGAQFTKTSQGVVMLRGLIEGGTMSATACFLPDGFKPGYTTWFQNYSASAIGRVDVYADRADSLDGAVVPYHGTNAWVSLSDIRFFVPPASPCDTWKNVTTPLSNGWSNYNNGFPPLRATKDCIGRVFLEGLLVPGTATSGTTITDLSASPFNTSYRPAIHAHFTTGSYSGGYIANALHILDTGHLQARGTASSYQSAQVMYHPTGIGTWTNLPLASPWTAYSAYYTPQYTKSIDGIVSIRGLAANNSSTCAGGSTIGNLPAGYRPSEQLLFSAMYSATSAVRIDVSPAGQIICYTTLPASTYVSLNQIQFIADQ